MQTRFSIRVDLVTGESRSYKNVETFEVMPNSILYIKIPPEIKRSEKGNHLVGVTNRNERIWIPFHTIKHLEVITWLEITDPKELKRYEAFKKRGIDMTIVQTSYTAPPDPREVEKEIEEAEGKEEHEKPTN